MAFKKLIFKIHQTLGLTTGIVVFIVSLTGCCWSFKEEIESLYDNYKTVSLQEADIIEASKAKELAQKVFPKQHIHGVLYQNDKQSAVEVIFYNEEPEFYQSVFLNPYSGDVIKKIDHTAGFFGFVLKGHVRLWLPKAIGKQIVGVSVIVFLLIIVSGIILWLPKKRKKLKQRLKFDWKKTTRWKRKNFDLHSIIGFYASSITLIIAFTGCIMAYNWFYYLFYKSIGGEKTTFFEVPKNINEEPNVGSKIYPMDKLIPLLKKENPEAKSFELHYPEDENHSIYVEVEKTSGIHYDADYRFFDKNTLTEIETNALYGKYENTKVADKIMRMSYDIHIGSIAGIPGKIIAFLISLLTASLPITGILLWYGRKYKKTQVK